MRFLRGINTTILLVNRRGNRKHLLTGGNLLSSCLGVFGCVTALSRETPTVCSFSFLQPV